MQTAALPTGDYKASVGYQKTHYREFNQLPLPASRV